MLGEHVRLAELVPRSLIGIAESLLSGLATDPENRPDHAPRFAVRACFCDSGAKTRFGAL